MFSDMKHGLCTFKAKIPLHRIFNMSYTLYLIFIIYSTIFCAMSCIALLFSLSSEFGQKNFIVNFKCNLQYFQIGGTDER